LLIRLLAPIPAPNKANSPMLPSIGIQGGGQQGGVPPPAGGGGGA